MKHSVLNILFTKVLNITNDQDIFKVLYLFTETICTKWLTSYNVARFLLCKKKNIHVHSVCTSIPHFLFPYFATFPLLNFLPITNLYNCCFFSLNSSTINSILDSLNRFFLMKYATVAASCHVGFNLLSIQSSFINGKHISCTALLVWCSCNSSSCLLLLFFCSVNNLSMDGEFITIASTVVA